MSLPPPSLPPWPPDPADVARERVGRRRRAVAVISGVLGSITLAGVLGLVAVLALLSWAASSFEGCEIDTDFSTAVPGNGTESERVPVSVTPATGLVEDQVVYVTSDAFDALSAVGVAVCLVEADVDAKGAEACDLDGGTRFATDADGHLAAAITMPRVITVRGTAHDCAEGPERCIVVAASARDFDRSGGQPVTFAPVTTPPDLTPAGPRPKSDLLPITATPAGPAAAETEITVTATGFVPGEPILVAPCTVDFPVADAWDVCEPVDSTAAFAAALGTLDMVADHADAAGSFTTTVTVPASVRPYSGTAVTCDADGSCGIAIAAAADFKRSAFLPLEVG
jgi:hypothetical protein